MAWISSVSGGPIDYKGKSLKEVHKDKGVTNAEFDVAEDHLREVLKNFGVGVEDSLALMKIVETTRADIVQPKKEPPPVTTLWQRIGGDAGAAAIIDEFVNAAAKDPKVNFFRNPKYVPNPETVIILKQKLVEQTRARSPAVR